MVAMHVDLIMKFMVNCYLEIGNIIDVGHNLLKFFAMPSFCETRFRVGQKEKGVDHFVQQCLLELVGCAILQQWGTEFNGT